MRFFKTTLQDVPPTPQQQKPHIAFPLTSTSSPDGSKEPNCGKGGGRFCSALTARQRSKPAPEAIATNKIKTPIPISRLDLTFTNASKGEHLGASPLATVIVALRRCVRQLFVRQAQRNDSLGDS